MRSELPCEKGSKGRPPQGRIGFESIFFPKTNRKNPAMRQHGGIFVNSLEQKICISKLLVAP